MRNIFVTIVLVIGVCALVIINAATETRNGDTVRVSDLCLPPYDTSYPCRFY